MESYNIWPFVATFFHFIIIFSQFVHIIVYISTLFLSIAK